MIIEGVGRGCGHDGIENLKMFGSAENWYGKTNYNT